MFKRLVSCACIVMLSAIAASTAFAETIIVANQSCRTDVTRGDTNNHDSSKLSVRSDDKSAKSWIKFDISELDVSNLGGATLTVTLHEPKSGDRNFDVSYVNDDCLDNIDWDERSLAWNNAPGNNTADFGGLDTSKTTLLGTVNFTDGVAGDAFTIDVLEALLADTDGIVQFVLHNSNGLLNFATHDHAEEAWRPFITVSEGPRAKAKRPNPAHGAEDVYVSPVLSWVPGGFADRHDVYLGTVFDDVNNASAGNPLLVSPSQDANTYEPGPLEFGRTYFWRVDEVNAPPDPTVFKGDVWSFTTEPYAYPVTPAAATASSAQTDMGPEKTIDGSGLTDDLHGVEATTMWLTDGPAPHWIRYEFDKTYKLHEMEVWNSNQLIEGFIGFGARQVAIETSLDGATWTPVADVPEFSQAPGAAGYAANTTIHLGGILTKYVKLTITAPWSNAPQTGLSEVRFTYVPVQAREPQPADDAAGAAPDVMLSWRPGREATSHTVYLGTDQAAVATGAVAAVPVTEPSYTPGALNLDATYFWRVDEVGDAGTYPGDIWSFATTEYVVVDDFESYNDEENAGTRIYETWDDGWDDPTTNGSQVGYIDAPFAERAIIHGGRQSMPLTYDNTDGKISEATRTFAAAQDWTQSGITTLVVYFHGTAGNTGQLYVKINNTKISYPGNAADVATEAWTAWEIDLAASGASLASVSKLSIGIDGGGASGLLYVDDIQLK